MGYVTYVKSIKQVNSEAYDVKSVSTLSAIIKKYIKIKILRQISYHPIWHAGCPPKARIDQGIPVLSTCGDDLRKATEGR